MAQFTPCRPSCPSLSRTAIARKQHETTPCDLQIFKVFTTLETLDHQLREFLAFPVLLHRTWPTANFNDREPNKEKQHLLQAQLAAPQSAAPARVAPAVCLVDISPPCRCGRSPERWGACRVELASDGLVCCGFSQLSLDWIGIELDWDWISQPTGCLYNPFQRIWLANSDCTDRTRHDLQDLLTYCTSNTTQNAHRAPVTFTSSLTDFGGRRGRGTMALLTFGTSTLGACVGSGIYTIAPGYPTGKPSDAAKSWVYAIPPVALWRRRILRKKMIFGHHFPARLLDC